MADQAGQVNAIKRAWPSPKPPAVKAGTKKRGTSCTTDSVRLAEADNLIAGRSLGMVVLCAADVDRFRQGKGALTHPPPPTSPALKTHATFLCSARPSRIACSQTPKTTCRVLDAQLEDVHPERSRLNCGSAPDRQSSCGARFSRR